MAAIIDSGATVADTNATTSLASSAFTPAASDLLVVLVTATGTVATGSVSNSAGLTFTLVTSEVRTGDTCYVFVADSLAAATSQTCTFDCSSDAATGIIISVARISGMSLAGSSSIRQFAKANNAGTTTPEATFASSALTGNPTIAFVANATNPAGMTPPTSWTERVDTGFATPNQGLEYASRDSGFTGTVVTWGSVSSAHREIIVEFEASVVATSNASFLFLMV